MKVSPNAGCEYFTEGKVYTVLEEYPSASDERIVDVLSDDGDRVTVMLKDCPHTGTPWTIVEDEKMIDNPKGFDNPQEFDNVEKPSHYQVLPGIEVKDIREALLDKVANGVPYTLGQEMGEYDVTDEAEEECKNMEKQLTGGSVDYYKVKVENPTSGGEPYTIEVNDFIEAFDLNFAEGNIIKAIARLAQLRRDAGKPGSFTRYEAEKQKFFADRVYEKYCR